MTPDSQWLQALTSTSFLYGPFFFAILFMLVITRIAHSNLQEVSKRADPPAPREEVAEYRWFLKASWACGIVMVFIAIGWWIFAQLQKHSYEGVIMGLDPAYTITTDDNQMFIRTVERDKLRDYHFAIIRDRPFVPGQKFRLGLFDAPGGATVKPAVPIRLTVTYTGTGTPTRYILSKEGSGYRLEKGD